MTTHDNADYDKPRNTSSGPGANYVVSAPHPDVNMKVIEPATRMRRFVYRLSSPLQAIVFDWCWAKGDRVCAVVQWDGTEKPVKPYVEEDADA